MRYILKYIVPIVIIGVLFIIHQANFIQFVISDYLTFTLIFLTYFYVYFTWETLDKMKQESFLERRPYIIADFTSERSELGFYLTNIGKTPAKNIKVKIVPDIVKFNGDTLNSSIFNEEISFFPPHKKVETTINTTSIYFRENSDHYIVKLNYTDSFNNKFSEEINLNLNHHKKQSYLVEKDLQNVIDSLEKINNTLTNKKSVESNRS